PPNVAPAVGLVIATVGAALPPLPGVYASTSVIRVQVVSAAVTQMRIFVVVTVGNDTVRHTKLLPMILPPETTCHAPPSQYCTWKFCSPYNVNVWPAVGVTGLDQLSWTLNTSTSLMLCVPAKSTSSQSGQLSHVPSFHPPPLPHAVPVRSPLIAPLAANPELNVDDAIAVAPFAAAATLIRVAAPVSLTVNVWPAMVIVPVRAAPELASTE